MSNKKLKILTFIAKGLKGSCTECGLTYSSPVCKLRIFNATCQVKAVKENYSTGCYDVVDKNKEEL